MQNKVVASQIEGHDLRAGSLEIDRIEYAAGRLNVVLKVDDVCAITAQFSDVIGFRMMDERDLHEYWPACSSLSGVVFEIHSGGWLDQEMRRAGSCIGFYSTVREYLVTSMMECVSVLCSGRPTIATALKHDQTDA